MTIAVYAGSFDPITNGHIHIIEKACRLFDNVFVLIACSNKKKYTFTEKERLSMCKDSLDSSGISADVKFCHDRFVAEFAVEELAAQFLVRGIRSVNDFQEEFDMYHINKKISSCIETVFLMPDIDLSALRSSIVKGLVGNKSWWWPVRGMVSDSVLKAFARKKAELLYQEVNPCPGSFGRLDKIYGANSYHDWIHILNCVQVARELESSFKSLENAIKALILHDAVDLRANGLDPERDDWWYDANFAELVRATDHSSELDPSGFSKDARLVHDIDLEVLSWSPDRYQKYTELVRKEYNNCSNKEWSAGRSEFLKSMMGRKIIYWTEEFYTKNLKARLNMNWELSQLG